MPDPNAATAAALPPGTRRPTENELRWLAESHRWIRNTIGPDSAWITENDLMILSLPGRELVMTPKEWQLITAEARADERQRIRQAATPYDDGYRKGYLVNADVLGDTDG